MLVPSVPELLVILGIVVVIFGGAKLPKLGGDVAQAIRNFKEGLGHEENDKAATAPPQQIQDADAQAQAKGQPRA